MIRNARIILPRSRSRSSSAWCWRAAPPRASCSIRSWGAAPRRLPRSSTGGTSSVSRSTRNIARWRSVAWPVCANRTPGRSRARFGALRRYEGRGVENPVWFRTARARGPEGPHSLRYGRRPTSRVDGAAHASAGCGGSRRHRAGRALLRSHGRRARDPALERKSAELATLLRARGIDMIFLLAPTSTEKRIEEVAKLASGYIYYVSLRGVTGAKHLDLDDVAAKLPAIRGKTRLPVGVGFGIRDGQTARAVAQIADAVVIGSRIIQEMEQASPKTCFPRRSTAPEPARRKTFRKACGANAPLARRSCMQPISKRTRMSAPNAVITTVSRHGDGSTSFSTRKDVSRSASRSRRSTA